MEEASNHHTSSTDTGTHDLTHYAYDRSYEWPWDFTEVSSEPRLHISQHHQPEPSSDPANNVQGCLRVLVSVSRSLSPSHRIGLLDGFTEIQFGRDATDSGTPKVRLKEMEVSKLHAAIYWDESWNGWGIVDMGSKHGTFLRSAAGASIKLLDDHRGVRLSASKSASIPRCLYHSDEITIGSTTFVVHIHEDGLPCEECSPAGGDEIPLFPIVKRNKLYHEPSGPETIASRAGHDPKAKMALSQLKRNLLARHSEGPTSDASGNRYVDRSALRRALYPSSLHSEAPGVDRRSTVLPSTRCTGTSMSLPAQEPTSQPEAPIPPSSIGHQLLLKQGWRPGTSLGLQGEGRIDPIDVRASYDRAGLGLRIKSPPSKNDVWKNKYSN